MCSNTAEWSKRDGNASRSGPRDSAGYVYDAALKQTSRLRSLLYHSTHMARDVVFSINVDHVGFVVDNVALGQVSVALSVSFRCGIRTVK
jgi:hypothetical protein